MTEQVTDRATMVAALRKVAVSAYCAGFGVRVDSRSAGEGRKKDLFFRGSTRLYPHESNKDGIFTFRLDDITRKDSSGAYPCISIKVDEAGKIVEESNTLYFRGLFGQVTPES